jgi:hypothetical protein
LYTVTFFIVYVPGKTIKETIPASGLSAVKGFVKKVGKINDVAFGLSINITKYNVT